MTAAASSDAIMIDKTAIKGKGRRRAQRAENEQSESRERSK